MANKLVYYKMDYLIAYHLREHFRYIGNQNPFLNCIDVKDLTFLVSLKKQYPTNYVVGVTSPEDNKTLIQILEKTINLKAISFTWFSYPMDPYLLANLTSAGLKHLAPLTGVFYDLRQEQTQPALSPHLKLSIAKDVTHFKDFVFIFEQTWNHPQGYGEFFFKNLLNSKRLIPFVLYHHDIPVGACVLDIQNEIAGCYWDCVLPAYRNQGLGRLMVQARLKLAQEKGCKTVVAQCLSSSLNVYTNLGFQRICDMALFRYSNP